MRRLVRSQNIRSIPAKQGCGRSTQSKLAGRSPGKPLGRLRPERCAGRYCDDLWCSRDDTVLIRVSGDYGRGGTCANEEAMRTGSREIIAAEEAVAK